MLTPELVHARRQKGQLFLVPLGAREREAHGLARELLVTAEEMIGQSRQELEAAWDAIPIEPRDRKLKDGLCKLIEDRLAFDVETAVDPVEVRRKVFVRATIARRAGAFDRAAVLAEAAEELGLTAAAVDQALFCDLKNAHVVRPKQPGELVPGGVEALVSGYDLAQRQAVLLRATEVVVELRDPDKAALRSLLRKLKFLRLLFEARSVGVGVVHLHVDGPFSLFESTTKYGLSLALALPWIEATGEHRIVADVRWGKERLPLRFVIEGPRRREPDEGPPVPEELTTLVRKLEAQPELAWRVEPADVILSAKANGTIVPDLVFTHRESGARVYLELMGYWSREALWRRIELVEKGLLEDKVVFCASERLRVSEEALESPHAALLTYKGAISASALLTKIDALVRTG